MFSKRTSWSRAVNRYTEAIERRRRMGWELLDLTASNPTDIGLSYRKAELLSVFNKREALTYQPIARGLPAARQAVAAYYAEKGCQVDPEDLVLTTSTSEAYSFAFRLLCNPGDSILAPVPSYPLFDFLADLNDVRLVPYELVYDHGWQVDFTSLDDALESANKSGGKCRAILVVHPNNPTGSYVKHMEMQQLQRYCAANELSIIADEVFLDYSLSEQLPESFSNSGEALTFTLSGLSKISGLPQMKVAWLATSGPRELRSEAMARLEIIADTYLSMSAPVQLALPEMLAERNYIQPQLMNHVRQNLVTLDAQLAKQSLCSRLEIEGGWYAVLRVPCFGTDEELAVSLLEKTSVLLQPGHFYNFPSDGYLIASLITPCSEFEKGIARTLEYLAVR